MVHLPHSSMTSSYTTSTEISGVKSQAQTALSHEVGMPGAEVEMLEASIFLEVCVRSASGVAGGPADVVLQENSLPRSKAPSTTTMTFGGSNPPRRSGLD
jgi:hypothetical protein